MILPVDPTRYAAFLGVMAVMAVTPGPANLFAIAIGAERGKRAALVAVAGMNSATLVWFGVAALGLGAAVLAFPRVFHLIAYAGAAYMAWLGLKSLLAARIETMGELRPASIQPGAHAWRDGFAVQISNPKAILFFTAVLPPFLDPDRPLALQLASFACGAIAFDVIAMGAYGLGGAALARRMTEARFRRRFQLLVGLLLISAAALMALRH